MFTAVSIENLLQRNVDIMFVAASHRAIERCDRE